MRSIPAAATSLLLSLSLASSSIHSSAELGPQGVLFEQALGQAGLSGEQLHFDNQDRGFFGGDKYRLPFFDALTDSPWKLSPYGRVITDMLLTKLADPSTVLISAQSRINQGIRLGLVGDELEMYQKRVDELGSENLATALAELDSAAGVSGAKPGKYKAEGYDDIPAAARDSAALVVFVMRDALEYRRQALDEPIKALGYDPQRVYTEVLSSTMADEQNDDVGGAIENTLLIEKLLDRVDFDLLNTGATLLTMAAQRASQKLAEAAAAPHADFVFIQETALGWVAISSREKLRLDVQYSLLNIALRGNDTYMDEVAAPKDYAHPFGVSIDCQGDDTYGMANDIVRPQAAGVFGYGILLDLSGNDTYTSKYGSQAFGLFGTGLLCDAVGNDRYTAEAAAQGCGIYGTGVLIDGAGDDTYDTYQYSQGYGFTKGVGLLLDGSGSDRYTANDTDIRFGGPQTKDHNTSMAQGVGNGRRGDYVDGHSWAGGVGMLVDGGGDDAYSAGLFAQACAYWYGTGILSDKGGNDSYSGVWYVQGSGAHFGLSLLQDDAGADTYKATMNMAQGAGHDFSLGWLEDSAGNDSYTAPNLSLGGANANGIGVLWDKAGDDSYRSKGVTLGCAGGVTLPSVRGMMLNCGVFVDGGGSDVYEEIVDSADGVSEPSYRSWDFAGNARAWTRAGQSGPGAKHEYGVGVDAP
jgi:hypothetical protein